MQTALTVLVWAAVVLLVLYGLIALTILREMWKDNH
jgi:hypothetical protein